MEVGKCAPALVEPEAVAGEELVRNGEADVAERELVDEPAVRTIEERHRREARRAPEAERPAEEVERQPRVDDVLDDEDVPVLERRVDVLEQPHRRRRWPSVYGASSTTSSVCGIGAPA